MFKKMSLFTSTVLFSTIATVFIAAGCNYIAPYNQKAYEHATMLKAETFALMDKASEPYEQHEDAAESLRTKVLQAYEYAKGIPKNSDSAEQWKILADPSRSSVAGFLEFWKEKSVVSETFRIEIKKEISKHFDTIINLESAKIKNTSD